LATPVPSSAAEALDEAGWRLWMEGPKLHTELLYSTGIAAGLSSNDIRIDRGALSFGNLCPHMFGQLF